MASLTDTLAQLAQQFPTAASEAEESDEQYVLLEFDGLAADELRGELSLQAAARLVRRARRKLNGSSRAPPSVISGPRNGHPRRHARSPALPRVV